MGKTALITGAGRGIGLGLAQKLDAEGWTVFATYNRSSPDALTALCSDRLVPVQCDVSDEASIARVVEQVRARRPQLDLLVNNAGVAIALGPLEALDLDELRLMMAVNFWAPLHFARGLAPALRASGEGKIINIGSTSVYLLIPGVAGYPISKAALDTLTRNLRAELSPFGVQACVLHPGAIDTDMNSVPEDASAAFWKNVRNADLRALYSSAFPAPGSQLEDIRKMPTGEFADLIYRKIVLPRRIKAVYALGPYATVTQGIFSFLPYRLFERVQRSISGLKTPTQWSQASINVKPTPLTERE